MSPMRLTGLFLIACVFQGVTPNQALDAQSVSGPLAQFAFDGTIANATDASVDGLFGGTTVFVEGLDGQALSLRSNDPLGFLTLDGENLPFDRSHDLSVRFWIRTVVDSDKRFVILSQKDFVDNSLAAQKLSGWVFYVSGGTWAWNMGSGARRITYERDNGMHMPLNDGRWHQLAMTYNSARSEVRLFYDGVNRASYNVSDSEGFDFSATSPVTVGWNGTGVDPQPAILPAIEHGADQLQRLVDAFNGLGLKDVEPGEFASLIVDPRRLFDRKVNQVAELLGADRSSFLESMESVDFEPVTEVEAELMRNPYTVHQAMSFMEAAPLLKIYALVDGEVTIRQGAAETYAERERLYPPDFDMDNLTIWNRVLSPAEVLESYAEYFTPVAADIEEELTSLTAGSWNIFHGGKHYTIGEHGWDSRMAIAEILKREDVDVLMMQETYSSGDFIAAELGYYFATTVDWDYLNQGANISVLSRYPIKELYVQEDSPFMNVGVKIAISETQDLYAMSNWYGMQQFPAVFDFHESRFQDSDVIPTIFAGDFNAVPHTDGGDSPASRAMLDAGFTDAFRSLYTDAQEYPGSTHRNGRRIDQLYYKGVGLQNTSTRLISTWPTGFPSDHLLILSTFDLNYSTPEAGR
jgi:exonuclease III